VIDIAIILMDVEEFFYTYGDCSARAKQTSSLESDYGTQRLTGLTSFAIARTDELKRVHVRVRQNWNCCNSTFARGYAFVGDELLVGEALARYFVSEDVEGFEWKLRKADGLFAVIHVEDDCALLGVDHVASSPLYFGSSGSEVFVSDDAYWVAEELKENGYERLAVAEFLISGNVSGGETLFPRVKRVLAGEILLVRAAREGITVNRREYYAFTHHDFFTEDEESLLRRLDTCMTRAFERLVRSAKGRTIALSLSAGYDSRLVAMMLKKVNYPNVICFNYGLPGSRESKISRGVAELLGFDWEFIPYSCKLWSEWFRSEERKSCLRYVDGLATSPYVQDWPAVSKLKEEATIPEDSFIVQGHGGDFLAGDDVTKVWIHHAFSLESLLDILQAEYFEDWDLRSFGLNHYFGESTESLVSKVRNKTRTLLAGTPCSTLEDAASAFDHYFWKHRGLWRTTLWAHQFFGYGSRVPLWDPLAVSFWTRVPLHYKFGKRLYIRFVERIERELGVDQPIRSGSVPYPQGYPFMRILHATGLAEPMAKSGVMNHAFRVSGWLRGLSYKNVYDRHNFAWYGIMSKEQYRRLHSKRPKNLYAILAAERLGLISF
jgi:asparagine synthase (glutamine-hydrolysing)